MADISMWSGKTCPPDVGTTLLKREALIRSLLPEAGEARKLAVVGRAGQGKTVFALQYLQAVNAPFVWYQCGPEDIDPVFFLQNLTRALIRTVDQYFCAEIEALSNAGADIFATPSMVAQVLTNRFAECVTQPLYLVFDDVHLLSGNTPVLVLLRELVASASQDTGFLFLSRHEYEIDGSPMFSPGMVEYIKNSRLALSLTESAELLSTLHSGPVTSDLMQHVYSLTEGWPMGIALACDVLSTHGTIMETLPDHFTEDLACFFHEAYLDSFSPAERQLLLKASLLREVDESMLSPDILGFEGATVLERLCGSNAFVRKVGGKYVFHHLFQQCLANQARTEISEYELTRFLVFVGDYHKTQARHEEALSYYLEAGELDNARMILREHGLALLGENRTFTLQYYLSRFSREDIRKDGWLSLYSGFLQLQVNPIVAQEDLYYALSKFIETDDSLGELQALVQLIMVQVIIYGYDSEADKFVSRTEYLLSNNDALPEVFVAQANKALAAWYTFYKEESEPSIYYATVAREKAEELGQKNAAYESGVIEGLARMLKGKLNLAGDIFEHYYRNIFSLDLSNLVRFSLFTTLANLLEMQGDFVGYRHFCELLRLAPFNTILEQSSIKPFLSVWDIDAAIATGDIEQAEEILSCAEKETGVWKMPHMASQFAHYAAFIAAIRGDERTLAKAETTCFTLREKVHRNYFHRLSRVIIGGAYALLGHAEKAEEYLVSAVRELQDWGETHTCSAGLFHLAALRLRTGHPDANATVKEAVELFAANEHRYFFSWYPPVVKPVLTAAVAAGVRPEYCRSILREKMDTDVLESGETVPLLHIDLLGPMVLRCGSNALGQEELTQMQREFLALLVVSGGKVSQSVVQNELWPDITPDAARNRFDVLLSRTRKTLVSRFGKQAGKLYISLQRGVVVLYHYESDATVFRNYCENGKRFFAEEKYWQAVIQWIHADRCMRGVVYRSSMHIPSINRAMESAVEEYCSIVPLLAELMGKEGRKKRSLDLLRKAYDFDPVNVGVARCYYDKCCEYGEPAKATRFIKQFSDALRRMGYMQDEVEEVMESFWSKDGHAVSVI